MTQLTDLVRTDIQTSPSVRLDLQKRIINIRALAKHIRKKYGLSDSLDAIISAIRRTQESTDETMADEDVSRLIISSTLSMKNQIASILLDKNEAVLRAIPKIFEKVETASHGVLRVVHAQKSVKIFVDQAQADQTIALFSAKDVKTVERNLGQVIMEMPPRSWRKLGVLSLLTSELYLNRINILECHTCIPEIVFIVREDDLTKAYQVLYSLSKGTARQK